LDFVKFGGFRGFRLLDPPGEAGIMTVKNFVNRFTGSRLPMLCHVFLNHGVAKHKFISDL